MKFVAIIKKIIKSLLNENLIEIDSPRPNDYIGANFTISGWVHLSWFEREAGSSDWRMLINYLGLDARTFMGTAPSPILDDQNMKGDKVYFSIDCELTWANISFIQNSHARITIRIESPNKKNQPIYLPLIVKQFEDGVTNNTEIIEQHKHVGEMEMQYINDLKLYYKEMEKVYKSRKEKDEGRSYEYLYNDAATVAFDMFEILDEEESLEQYTYENEDKRENELYEKYKNALDWQGPLARGIVSEFNGFELRVYSDDHDKHFHVIHRGKKIDARFSFPEMTLLNYKNTKNTISSKTEKKIREYCLKPEIYKVFEKEFSRRP
jgi:hypothetical protein